MIFLRPFASGETTMIHISVVKRAHMLKNYNAIRRERAFCCNHFVF